MKLNEYLIERGKQNEEALKPIPGEATSEDYESALSDLGVNNNAEN